MTIDSGCLNGVMGGWDEVDRMARIEWNGISCGCTAGT